MSLSPLVFTGVSKYSDDFQTIIDRATKIAQLPVTQLQNQQKDLLQQKIQVGALSAAASSLSTALGNLGKLASQKALNGTSSDTSRVTVSSVNASAPASYVISDISSIARSAAETSLSGYADSTTAAVSSTGHVRLSVAGQNYDLDLSGSNNLTGLRNAINGLHAGVTASVLTTGTGATPYYLSITANATGAKALELHDDPTGANTNLITANNPGANTEFKINGVAVSKASSVINDVVPGVTFTIRDTTTSGQTVSLNLASSRTNLETALDSFVSAYNAARDQVNGQSGEAAGLLSGDFLVRELGTKLSKLTTYYQASGSIHGLADLGVVIDSNGVASLDSTVIDNLAPSELEDAFSFLGTSTSGFGGISRDVAQISDPFTGLAKLQTDQYDAANRRINERITDINSRISDMQKSMASRLQVMDTLLASLQSQQNTLTASIDSLTYSTYGKSQ